MARNTCPVCRTENLLTAIACVACGALFDDPGGARDADVIPPRPDR